MNLPQLEGKVWYKDGYFWRHVSEEWEKTDYGFYPNGKGDLISNTMMKIWADGDDSEWAYNALRHCRDLLQDQKRWPDRMNHKYDSRGRIDSCWSKILYFGEASSTVRYRWQDGMTRDPYTFFYAVCIMLDKEEYIEDTLAPWYIFRIGNWAWRKCLIEKTWYWDLLYREKGYHRKEYVRNLRMFRRWAYSNA